MEEPQQSSVIVTEIKEQRDEEQIFAPNSNNHAAISTVFAWLIHR
jgi:hypothetical protein